MDRILEAELALVAAIFRRQPDTYVWAGGSVLQILHQSPRSSYDVDLVPVDASTPQDLACSVAEALAEVNAALGLGLEVAGTENADGFARIRIGSKGRVDFSVDLASIAGGFRATRTVLVRSAGGTAAVRVPADSCLLAAKIRALVLRRFPKPGDLFDVWFLIGSGVKLDKPERTALRDELLAEEIDEDELDRRLNRFRGKAWIDALSRAGVSGLTPETGAGLLDKVRHFTRRLLP